SVFVSGCSSTPSGTSGGDRRTDTPPPGSGAIAALPGDQLSEQGVDIQTEKTAQGKTILIVDLKRPSVKDDTLATVAKLDGPLRLILRGNKRISDNGLA